MEQKILVAVDGSEASERAVEYAAKVAKDLEKSHLTIFNVGEAIPPRLFEHDVLPGEGTTQQRLEKQWQGEEELEKSREGARESMFSHLAMRAESLGLRSDQIDTRYSADGKSVATEIITEAEKGGYDVICLGKKGRSTMAEFFIGSVSERVVRHAKKCSVWVVE